MLKLEKCSDVTALVGRLFFASLFLLYGYKKLMGYAGAAAYMAKVGLPPWFAVLAIIFELGGGLLMVAGFHTRLTALMMAVYVLVASYFGHGHVSDPAQLVHFMKNMSIIGGCFAFVALGAGRYSLDAGKR